MQRQVICDSGAHAVVRIRPRLSESNPLAQIHSRHGKPFFVYLGPRATTPPFTNCARGARCVLSTRYTRKRCQIWFLHLYTCGKWCVFECLVVREPSLLERELFFFLLFFMMADPSSDVCSCPFHSQCFFYMNNLSCTTTVQLIRTVVL